MLLVATPAADGVDPLGSQLGHSCGPGQLELPLHADGHLLAAGGAALMPVIARDTHDEVELSAEREIKRLKKAATRQSQICWPD